MSGPARSSIRREGECVPESSLAHAGAPIGEDPMLRIDSAWRLDLALSLQTTLDIGCTVELFARHSATIVPHDAVVFAAPQAALSVTKGRPGACGHSVELVLDKRPLGCLTFSRRGPFEPGEILALEAMARRFDAPPRQRAALPRGARSRNPRSPDRGGQPSASRAQSRTRSEPRASPRRGSRASHGRHRPFQVGQRPLRPPHRGPLPGGDRQVHHGMRARQRHPLPLRRRRVLRAARAHRCRRRVASRRTRAGRRSAPCGSPPGRRRFASPPASASPRSPRAKARRTSCARRTLPSTGPNDRGAIRSAHRPPRPSRRPPRQRFRDSLRA